MTPPLHPHQHETLVTELRGQGYQGVSESLAFARVTEPDVLKRLGRTRYMTAAELNALPPKRRPREMVVVITDEQRAMFPTGVPGFPNKLRREWFDAARAEARG